MPRHYFVLKDFPGPGKKDIFFNDFQEPVATLVFLPAMDASADVHVRASVS